VDTSKFPPVRYDVFRLQGGLDLITPTLALKPGVARNALNFEVAVTGGYTRVPGYERFDGRAAPSNAGYAVITLNASVATVAVGNTIQTSGGVKTGVVLAVDTVNNIIVYTLPVGTFVNGDVILVGASSIGTVITTTAFMPSSLTQATYTAAAADVYRALIQVVPGSGPVRGVVYYNNVVYAWRNNAGGTAMAIYKSSTSGWVNVPLGWELPFNAGTNGPWAEGSTVYGNTSGATGVVARVALSSGTAWVGGSGRLILSATTGTFQNGEILKLTNAGGVANATCGGPAVAITLAPGGRVQTFLQSFGNNTAQRIYGCDNVNRGFEFDGTVYVPITTGMPTDTPANVAVHKNFLFFSFGPSVQNSGIGSPYVWSPVFGANEFVLPEVVTGLLPLPGTVNSGSLAIFSRSNTYILYGYGLATFNLVPYNTGVGATAYTAQNLSNAYALDDLGVISLASSENFGNFDSATLTFAIKPFIAARRNLAISSGLNREKSQYRVFYSDGSGVYITIVNGKAMGSMPVQLLDQMNCWCEGIQSASTESAFAGGALGYVYSMDVGTSFDGGAINASFTLNYNSEGMSRVLKRYRRASLEVAGLGYAAFSFGYSLAYGSTNVDQSASTIYTVPFSPANWDTFVWDAFVWDGQTLVPNEAECIGTGENIAVTVSTNSNLNVPFTINSITLHYTPRRGIR
jgi:hypothetical protein